MMSMMRTQIPTPRRILIARGDALGDLVLATVVIRPLRELFPDAEIYFLARKEMVPLLMGIPDVAGVIENELSYAWSWAELSVFFRLCHQVKVLSPDVFLGLWEKRRYGFLSYIAGIPVRIGYAMSWLHRLLYTHVVPVDFSFFFTHQAVYNLALLGPLRDVFQKKQVNLGAGSPYIGCPDQWRSDVVSRYPGLRQAYACVQVDGSAMQKTWLPETCLSVVRFVAEQHAQVVLMGRPDALRRDYLKAGLADVSNVIDLTDQLSLPDVVAVLSCAQLFVGLDSGFAHLASAFSVPSVVYFVNRTQNALRWAPLGKFVHLVFAKHTCPDRCVPSVCQKRTCREGLLLSDMVQAINVASAGGVARREARFGQLTVGVISSHAEKWVSFLHAEGLSGVVVSPDIGVREMADRLSRANVMWVILDQVSYSLSYRLVRVFVSNQVMWPPLFFRVKDLDEVLRFIAEVSS